MTAEQCQRCNKNAVEVISRKELFCAECFRVFVMQKQRKQMMSDDYYRDIFKVMYKDKIRSAEEAEQQNKNSTILIPLSFGSSSLMMLDIVHLTLLEQKMQHQKTGFNVDVLICYRESNDELLTNIRSNIKELSTVRYSENKDNIRFHTLCLDSMFEIDKELIDQVVLHNVEFTGRQVSINESEHANLSLQTVLTSCPNRSTKEDIIDFVTKHLVKKYAYQNGQKAILWGHSMTRLADEIISCVVKGRGAQISSKLNTTNLDVNYGSRFKNLYPLKDILLTEVDAYCALFDLSKYLIKYELQDSLLVNKLKKEKHIGNQRLAKNMTINELARKYFNDIEGEYSNVIATVLRTGDKLDEPLATLGEKHCRICKSTVHDDVSKWLRDITVNVGQPLESQLERDLHEKWATSHIGLETTAYYQLRDRVWEQGDDVDLCYGCIVTMQGVKNLNVPWPKNNEQELNEVLAEYSLE